MHAVDVARQGLCRLIAQGELLPGQRLPGEVELGARFGVSRGSIREAQRMLAVAGILDPGGRPIVSDMSAESLMTGLSMVIPLLPLERYLELSPLREVLEGHMAAQAAAKMPDADITQLLAVAREERGLSGTDERAAELDQEFHIRLIRGGGDAMIGALLETIHQRGSHYRLLEAGAQENFKEISARAHEEIAEVIAARDPAGAQSLMANHVRMSRQWLERLKPKPHS